MGGGFSADEESLRDLGVRKSETNEVKDLVLALGESAGLPRPRPAGRAKRAKEGRCLVRVGCRSELLE